MKESKSAQKHLVPAKEHLESNEKIIDYTDGMYDSEILVQDTIRNGVLIATNKRVLFYGKKMMDI